MGVEKGEAVRYQDFFQAIWERENLGLQWDIISFRDLCSSPPRLLHYRIQSCISTLAARMALLPWAKHQESNPPSR